MVPAEDDLSEVSTPTETLTDMESGPARISHEAPPARINAVVAGRFELRRILGQGSSGRIYEAFDRDAQKPVAIKVLRHLGPRAIQLMKHEARELARFSHPNLVAVYDLVAHEGDWLFSMEYVNGISFDAAVRSAQRAPLSLLGELVPQLVAGVRALHARGRVHRDLKPANVLVTPEGRLVIVDFGLVRESLVADTDHGFVGTPSYAAPEQLLGHAAGPHSDWYAVGVMLYKALTGSLPYVGTTAEMLQAKRGGPPRRPSELRADVPSELDALCLGLLEPDAARRLDGDAVLAAFAVAPFPDASPEPDAAPSCFGRQDELATLRGAFERALAQRPTCVLVHGPSGIGKSHLTRAFVTELASHDGALSLAARCNPNEQLPFQTLDAIIDALASYLRKLPAVSAAALLNPEVHTLAKLFPVLKQLEALSEVPQPVRAEQRDEAAQRAAAARGLAALLTSISSRAPVVLSFADLHASDADGDELLALVMRHIEGRVLVLATSRNGNARALFDSGLFEIELGPLSAADTRELALSTLGAPASDTVLEEIALESRGNPLHAHELAASFRGALQASGTSLAEVFVHRLAALSDPERALVRAVSLAGTPVDRELLLASVPAADLSHLTHLAQTRILRADKGKTGKVVYEPYHQPIFEAALSGLAAEDRAALHGRLADAYLQRGGTSDVAAAVTHLLGAGRHDEAAVHAAESAREAIRTFAFHRAADLLSLALEHMRQGKKRDELEGLAREVFSAAGRFREAARSYAKAAAAASAEERFDLERRAMENTFFAGDSEQGYRHFVKLGAEVGWRIPRTRLGMLLRVTLILLRYLLFGLPRLAARPATGVVRRRADLAWSATAVQNSNLPAWGFTCALALGETARAGMRDEYLVLRVAWAAGLKGVFPRWRSNDAALVAEAERRAGESTLEAWLHVARGIYHYYASPLGRASDAFERATLAPGSAALSAGRRFARTALLACWFQQGLLRKIAQYAPEWADEAQRAEDAHLGPHMRVIAAMSYLDRDVERTRAELALVGATDQNTRRILQMEPWWEVWVEAYTGERERAYRIARHFRFRRPLEMPSSNHVIVVAVRGQSAAATMEQFPQRRSELTRAIRRLARNGHPWAQGFAELLAGTAHGAQGAASLACEALERAERAFEATGMLGYAAAARTRRGELLGGEAGRKLAAEGYAKLGELGFGNVQRWLEVLAPGFASITSSS